MKKIILSIGIATAITTLSTANSWAMANEHDHSLNTDIINQIDNMQWDGWLNNQIVDSMHMPMMNAELVESGNVDKDFIANMIPHHQGAVDSAKLILEHSKNEQVRAIAQNIIKTQEQEIAQFNDLLNDNQIKDNKIDEKAYQNFVTEEKAIMTDMMNQMIAVTKTRDKKSIDYTFILAMKYHHIGAIKASKQILSYTKDPVIRKIARNIIKDQSKEIKSFDKLIEKGL